MSSEESDIEEGQEVTKGQRRARVVKYLKNESDLCKRYKRDLDRVYVEKCPRQAECMVVAKRRTDLTSDRSIPNNPQWVFKEMDM